jgi:hypothetical protein
MSADNWATCPKCKRAAITEKERLLEEAAKAYGKVPPAEWKTLTENASKLETGNETLREDYELGVDSDGNFSVGYSCRCSECTFQFSFQKTEQAMPKEGA